MVRSMVQRLGMGETPMRRSSQATARAPYWARGLACRRARASTMRSTSSGGVRLGEVCGARERPWAQVCAPASSSERATHLRTQRLVRPSAAAMASGLSPERRRRTASLRSSSSDTTDSSLEMNERRIDTGGAGLDPETTRRAGGCP